MPAQLSLLDHNIEARHRYFFGIYVEADIAPRIAELTDNLRRKHRLVGEPLQAQRLHITLHHLGDYDVERKSIVAMALEAGEKTQTIPFTVAFDRVMSFRGKDSMPFALCGGDGLDDLKAFQRRLGEAMAKVGLGKWMEKNFNPHVTLLYDARRVDEQPVEPVRWVVKDFALVHSLLGETRHIVLGNWPLRG